MWPCSSPALRQHRRHRRCLARGVSRTGFAGRGVQLANSPRPEKLLETSACWRCLADSVATLGRPCPHVVFGLAPCWRSRRGPSCGELFGSLRLSGEADRLLESEIEARRRLPLRLPRDIRVKFKPDAPPYQALEETGGPGEGNCCGQQRRSKRIAPVGLSQASANTAVCWPWAGLRGSLCVLTTSRGEGEAAVGSAIGG